MKKEIKDKHTEAIFDDWVENSADCEMPYWTQVCDWCATWLGLLDSCLSLGEGSGICGVKGCKKEADHYYDFES